MTVFYSICPDCKRPWGRIPPPAGRSSVVTVDHIFPRAKGGSDSISNLRPLCYSCNSRKGARVIGRPPRSTMTPPVLLNYEYRHSLKARGRPYFIATARPGVMLGYRRLEGRAGTWSVRIADGQGSNRVERIGTADDLEAANGQDVLSFEQACARCLQIFERPMTGHVSQETEEATL
jgi:hypothetical protein